MRTNNDLNHNKNTYTMALTRDNMRTVSEGIRCDIGALVHDICEMDEPQLERYIRLALAGEIDPDFLPPEFWHGYSSIQSDRILSTGEYFGGQLFHRLIEESIPSRSDATLYQKGRERFARIFKKIMHECLSNGNEPNREALARTLVDVAWSIRFHEIRGKNYPLDNREIHGLGLRLNTKFKCRRDYSPVY